MNPTNTTTVNEESYNFMDVPKILAPIWILTFSLFRCLDTMSAIDPKTARFSLTSALAWFLSLRPVRLKIGDYYYEQGNFDQAVNWYQTQQR
jgi:hypothetical protein